MLKEGLLAAFLAIATTSCATSASSAGAIRLDATTDATAEKSFATMANTLQPEERQELLLAMVKLNLAGVESAYDVVQETELKSLSISRIKDQVDGMTAEEIVDLANRTSDVQAEIMGR